MSNWRLAVLALGAALAACSSHASEDPVDTTLPNDVAALPTDDSMNDTMMAPDAGMNDIMTAPDTGMMNDTMTAPEPLSMLGNDPSAPSTIRDSVDRKTADDLAANSAD